MQPRQRLARIARCRLPIGRDGAFDHHDANAEPARCFQFRLSGAAAGVLGDDDFDAVRLQQGEFILQPERAAQGQADRVGRHALGRGRIDAAYKIGMLRGCSERREILLPDGEQNPPRLLADSLSGCLHIGHHRPFVTCVRCPGGAVDRQEGNSGQLRGFDGVAFHLAGEGMGGVDQGVESALAQKCRL